MIAQLRTLLASVWRELRALLLWSVRELREAWLELLERVAPSLSARVWMRMGSDGATLQWCRLNGGPLPYSVARESGRAWPEVFRGPGEFDGARTIIEMSAEQVLLRELVFPVAAERALDSAVALQCERVIPIALADVFTSWKIVSRRESPPQIVVQLAVARRQVVEELRDTAVRWGLRPIAIGVGGGPSGPLSAVTHNFLARGLTGSWRSRSRLDRGLLAGVGALAIATLALIAGQWIAERVQVGRVLQSTAQQAAEVTKLETSLQQRMAPALALKQAIVEPDAVRVLATLTESMPSDSWANELDVTAKPGAAASFKLSAFTPVALQLVDRLSKQPSLRKIDLVTAFSASVGAGDRLQLTGAWLDVPPPQAGALSPSGAAP